MRARRSMKGGMRVLAAALALLPLPGGFSSGAGRPPAARPDAGVSRRGERGDMPFLRAALKSGAPAEKEEALNLFMEERLVALFPDVIDAVGDTTPLPRHGDTGWGFVGHQASSALARIAQSMDGVDLKDRGRRGFSFFDDMYLGGEELGKSGRLAEVRKNWLRWWDKTGKAKAAAVGPVPCAPPLALGDAVRIAEQWAGEHGADVSGQYISSARLCWDDSPDRKCRYWHVQWSWSMPRLGMEFGARVYMDGTVAPQRCGP